MSLLGPALMASVRGSVAGLFSDTWEVLRQVPVDDGQGGTTYTEAVASTGFGSLQQVAAGSDQQLVADRLAIKTPAVLFLSVDADVNVTDRVRVNTTRLFKVMDIGMPGTAAVKQIVMDEGS